MSGTVGGLDLKGSGPPMDYTSSDLDSTSDHVPLPLCYRTLEEVKASASAAGLSNSVGSVQLLHFSSQLHSEDIRIMEIEGPILSALRSGEKVVIRGAPNDDAVICTSDKTFDLRVADTSNTLLIAPSLELPVQTQGSTSEGSSLETCEITACLSSYLELRPCRPRIERLKELLNECPFQGPSHEEEESQQGWGVEGDSAPLEVENKGRRGKKRAPRKYTFEDLLNLVQASEEELYEALDRMHACPILGYWRRFDLDYRDNVVQAILRVMEDENWPCQRVPLNATCRLISEQEPDIPEFAVKHCFSCYGDVKEEEEEERGGGAGGETYYQLSELKVCQFFAELILRPCREFNYHEFLSAWDLSIPQGMKTSLSQLQGLALVDLNSAPPVVRYFSVADLPQEPAARFLRLFEVRTKWSFEEIEPYIKTNNIFDLTHCNLVRNLSDDRLLLRALVEGWGRDVGGGFSTHQVLDPLVKDLETPKQSLNALLMKFSRVSTDTARGIKLYSSKRIL